MEIHVYLFSARILPACLQEAFETIKTAAFTNGYALSDVLREISVLVLALGLPPVVLAQVCPIAP